MLSRLLVHLCIPLCKSTTALSAMPHLVSGINVLKNFANLLMMSPCQAVTVISAFSSSSSLSSSPLSIYMHHSISVPLQTQNLMMDWAVDTTDLRSRIMSSVMWVKTNSWGADATTCVTCKVASCCQSLVTDNWRLKLSQLWLKTYLFHKSFPYSRSPFRTDLTNFYDHFRT